MDGFTLLTGMIFAMALELARKHKAKEKEVKERNDYISELHYRIENLENKRVEMLVDNNPQIN